jgi:hypothetical protein
MNVSSGISASPGKPLGQADTRALDLPATGIATYQGRPQHVRWGCFVS